MNDPFHFTMMEFCRKANNKWTVNQLLGKIAMQDAGHPSSFGGC